MAHAVAVTHVNLMPRWMISGDSSTEPEDSNSLTAKQRFIEHLLINILARHTNVCNAATKSD